MSEFGEVFDGDGWRFRTWGVPTSPPIVLLHGFGGDSRIWGPVAAALAASFWVIAPDLPGHGRSKPPATGASLASTAAALHDHLETLGAADAPIVGYSLGGRLALHVALQHQPPALLLVGASAGLATEAERAARRETDAAWATMMRAGLPAFWAEWDAQPLFAFRNALPKAQQVVNERVRAGQDAVALACAMTAFGLGSQEALHEQLGSITCPVTLLVGEHDTKFRTLAEAMQRLFPAARLAIAPGSGHDVPTEHPDAVLLAVADLIQPIDSLPSSPSLAFAKQQPETPVATATSP